MYPIRPQQASSDNARGNDEYKGESDLNRESIDEATIAHIVEHHRPSWKLLRAIVWLNHAFIPEEILLLLADNDRFRLSAVMKPLEAFSLITVVRKRGHGTGVKLHKGALDQVIGYMRKYQKESENAFIESYNVLQALHKLLPYVTSNHDENWIKASLYMPSAEAVLKRIHYVNATVGLLNYKLGLIYAEMFDDLGKALIYKTRALQIWEELLPGNSPQAAIILNNAGLAYEAIGNIKKGLDYKNRALVMRQALYQGDHPDVADSIEAVGATYQTLGYINEGLDYKRRGFAMREALGLNSKQAMAEFKGDGTLSYVIDSSLEYYNNGLDQILELRLTGLDLKKTTKVMWLKSQYATKDLSFAAVELVPNVCNAFSSNVEIVIVPFNLYNEHWVGLLFRTMNTLMEVVYMDSEQGSMALELKHGLANSLTINGYESQFSQASLEKQKYNNCGPEVIENFVYYLTGTRATQERAVYLHSLLLENSLLDPKEYGLKLEENNKLIGFLSNKAPIPIQIPIELPIGGTLAINLLPAVNEFNRLAIKWLYDRLQEVNIVLYKATLGFKALDFTIDSARLLLEPGLDNAKKVALDASYLYSMYSGVNGYSALVSYAEATYQIHMGEYRAAFDVVAGTMSAMALPYILAHANRPYLSLAYGTWVAANTAYSAISNAYSFLLELANEDIAHRSTMAYKELAEYLEIAPLQATGEIFDYVVVDLDSNNP